MSVADQGSALVVEGEDGWEAMPFGMEGGSVGVRSSRDGAIELVEVIRGDMVCCVGHLADEGDEG